MRLLECQNYPIAAYDASLQRTLYYPSWFVFKDPLFAAPHYGMRLSLSVGCAPDAAMTIGFCNSACCGFGSFGPENVSPVHINGTVWAGFAVQEDGSDVALILGLICGLGVPATIVIVLVALRYRRKVVYASLEDRGHYDDL